MQDLVLDKQDYTYLSWTKIRSSSGTAGSFLKATEERGTSKLYYKLSDYDSVHGIVGHECVNELIVCRLLDVLKIPHLQYQLIHADIKIEKQKYETYLCVSENFRKSGEKKMTLEDYYQLERTEGEKPLDFCVRKGWKQQIYNMLVIDYLVLNRDRHGANIEIISDKKGNVMLAPLFDQGLSLLFSCHTKEEIEQYQVMQEKPVQCFVGGKSAFDNLNLIPNDDLQLLGRLWETDKDVILAGLDEILTKQHLDKIWEMIWKRWKQFESLRNL
ncbi:MAG TPA: hypothetical protein VJZ01_11505 [Lachnospiraceae bacterium]|nr:hypothetical protein [Lachnospiraceae bacterium]